MKQKPAFKDTTYAAAAERQAILRLQCLIKAYVSLKVVKYQYTTTALAK